MSMKKLKEAYFNKLSFKNKIGNIISDINSQLSTFKFKISPLVYKIKHKNTNEILYGMKVISDTDPSFVLRFNSDIEIEDSIHSISCWRNYLPINRKYPTPEYIIDGFAEDQTQKETSQIIDEIVNWLRSPKKQSLYSNMESIISIDNMPISDIYIQKEINDIFNISKETDVLDDNLLDNINDLKASNDSMVFVITDVDSREESESIISKIKTEMDVISGVNYFLKSIKKDELAVALFLNSKKNNDILILDNFKQWDDSDLMNMINSVITEGEITHTFENPELIPSGYPEDGFINIDIKLIIITPENESNLESKNYDFLRKNSSYEEYDIDNTENEINAKMNEILPSFLPKMTSSFKKDTISYILDNIDSKVINITIPELTILFEVKLVCKSSWGEYFNEIFSLLPVES